MSLLAFLIMISWCYWISVTLKSTETYRTGIHLIDHIRTESLGTGPVLNIAFYGTEL